MSKYKVVLKGLAEQTAAGKQAFLTKFGAAYKMTPEQAQDRIRRTAGVLYHFPNEDGAEKARLFLASIGGVAEVKVEETAAAAAPPLAASVPLAVPAPVSGPPSIDETDTQAQEPYGDVKRCPKCGFEVPVNEDQCPSCRIYISKYEQMRARKARVAATAGGAGTADAGYGGPPAIEEGVAATGLVPGGTMYGADMYGTPGPGTLYEGPTPQPAAPLSPYAGKGACPEATNALIAGVVGLFVPLFGFLLGLYALVRGVEALGEIRENQQYTGKGMAIAGIVLGIIDVIGWIAATVNCVNRMHGM
ncbi:MAG TPA: DUF4190 domain-containing protein [bacterium]|nr:DUF4190 domain-containing protein [bacterium]